MPDYGMIESGTCIDSIVADESFAQSYAAEKGYTAVLLPEGYGIGDYYNGNAWTKQEFPEPEEITPLAAGYEQRIADLEESYNALQAEYNAIMRSGVMLKEITEGGGIDSGTLNNKNV